MRGAMLMLLMFAAAPAVAQTVQGGSPDVLINGKPALRLGDKIEDCAAKPGAQSGAGQKVVISGSNNVFINGKPAARGGDVSGCDGAPKPGSPNVLINGR